MESFRLLQLGANTYQLITIEGKDIFPESGNQSNTKTYVPVFRLTSMRFLMWARSSTACTSVYPEWIASNSASCMKTYCCSTWTMRFLSRRKDVTYPNTSTVLSTAILCNMASTTIKVPVLPTPALQWTIYKKKECNTAQFHTSKNVYNHIAAILTSFGTEFSPRFGADASFVVFVTLCVWNATKESL